MKNFLVKVGAYAVAVLLSPFVVFYMCWKVVKTTVDRKFEPKKIGKTNLQDMENSFVRIVMISPFGTRSVRLVDGQEMNLFNAPDTEVVSNDPSTWNEPVLNVRYKRSGNVIYMTFTQASITSLGKSVI